MVTYRRRLPGSSGTAPWPPPRRRRRSPWRRTCPGAISANNTRFSVSARAGDASGNRGETEQSRAKSRDRERNASAVNETDHGELAVGGAQVGVGAVAGHAQHRVQAAAAARHQIVCLLCWISKAAPADCLLAVGAGAIGW